MKSGPASAFGAIALAVVFKGRQLRQPGDQALIVLFLVAPLFRFSRFR
jgi:hypothetical protein